MQIQSNTIYQMIARHGGVETAKQLISSGLRTGHPSDGYTTLLLCGRLDLTMEHSVFCNLQRTSTKNGILKAEAVLRIARIIRSDGVETFEDIHSRGLSRAAEAAIKQVPGQKSGLALSYFYMLAGDDTLAKPDRHVLRFINI